MTGEIAQPGGRAPAPGSLALVQAFLNTHYDLVVDHGADVWRSPDAYAQWLREHDLVADAALVEPSELQRALRVRDGLRTLARGDGGAAGSPARAAADSAGRAAADSAAALAVLNGAAAGAGVEVRFSTGGPSLVADGTAAGAVGLVLACTAVAMFDGTWERLKICPGHECGWAFYDHSRNGSGRWCSMSICGGREKSRAYYRRTRGHA